MAAFPSWIKLLVDLDQENESAVLATPMERGVDKVRRIKSDVYVEQAVTILLRNRAEQALFKTWFYTTINAGTEFFDWRDPLERVVVSARIKDGKLGAAQKIDATGAMVQRSFVVRFLQPAV